MSRFRAYINPRNSAGDFTSFIEVTEDMVFSSLGSINQSIDNDRYQVGLFKFDSFNFKLRNEHGKYSDVTVVESIFRFKRAGSKFKLTWQPADFPPICGIAICGEATLSEEITLYEGAINDEAALLDIDDQHISFNVLSNDSIFTTVETPFSLLSNDDLYSEALLVVLNQSAITEYLTVSAANINVSLDLEMDDISSFENTTVKEALDTLLFQSNSVMFINNNTIFIQSRDGGATSKKTFFGQASNNGIEDIIKLSNISTGLNSTFNYWTWRDTTLKSINQDSIDINGIRKKEISFDEITNTGKRQQVLDAQRDEFFNKKQELLITVPVDVENLDINILDQIRVDYPTVFKPAEIGEDLPLYGTAIYGEARYPFGEFSITISDLTAFKILAKKINTKNQLIIFKIKEM